MSYPALLACTILAELPVVALCAWFFLSRRGARNEDAAAPPGVGRTSLDCILVNLFSHPLAFLAVTRLNLGFVPVELAVVAAEALGYRALSGYQASRAIVISIAANGLTIAIALLLEL